MISPRDFVFVSHKVPPGDVGGAFGAQAYVQVKERTWTELDNIGV